MKDLRFRSMQRIPDRTRAPGNLLEAALADLEYLRTLNDPSIGNSSVQQVRRRLIRRKRGIADFDKTRIRVTTLSIQVGDILRFRSELLGEDTFGENSTYWL
ncbi:unnamed protein product, partial [Amoebophrya sp. A25]|eukprot:GSA25T00026445001.1